MIEHNGNAPYASPKNVLDVIERYRHRGLRTPFTIELMAQIGVPDGAVHRTLQSLKLLDLIDDAGNPTETLEALKRASEEEYRSLLAQVVQSAYHNVFAVVDPASDGPTALRDAFRFYKPDSQQERMLTLFLALCEEAGIIEKGPKKRGRAKPSSSPRRSSSAKPPASRASTPPSDSGMPSTATTVGPDPRSGTDGLHPLLVGVLQELPPNGRWSAAKRERWLATVTSAVDLLYSVESEPAGVAAEDG